MTKSAKQDTSNASAQAAESESAATSAADAAEAFDAMPEAADPSSASPSADGTTEDGDKQDIDDVKAKFREALDRKRQVHDEGQGKGGHESGKVSGAHGPAASRRNFRRKSG
jgi:Family of unknown function (DUF5302)